MRRRNEVFSGACCDVPQTAMGRPTDAGDTDLLAICASTLCGDIMWSMKPGED